MNRQKKLLLVCLAVLVLVCAYAIFSGPQQQRVAGTRQPARTVQQAPPPEKRPRVQLNLLEPDAGSFPGTRNDLFAALYPAPQRAPAPPAPPPVTPPPQRLKPKKPTPAPSAPSRPTQPPVRFSYLGFLEVEGRRVVFLESDDKVHLAREGETFGDGFRVLELKEDHLVIARGEEGMRQVIPLAEENAAAERGQSGFSVPGQQSRRPASLPAGRF